MFLAFLWLSFIGYAQDNYIVKTDDGRRVLLKADYTWEYIDITPNTAQPNEIIKPPIQSPPTPVIAKLNCGIAFDFEEPKLNTRVQAHLKRSRTTMPNLKKKVAKDFKCTAEDVLLLYVNEDKTKGRYTFCANGTKVEYKRTGSNFFKKGKFL